MDHAYFTDRMSSYHDNELPAQEKVIVGEHLATCPECQAMLEQFRQLGSMVAKQLELGGGEYWEKLALKTEERLGFVGATTVTDIKPKSRLGLGWKVAAVAASFAALSFIAYHQLDIATEDEIVPAPGVSEQKAATTPSQRVDTAAAPGVQPEAEVADNGATTGQTQLQQKQIQERSETASAGSQAAAPNEQPSEGDAETDELRQAAPAPIQRSADNATREAVSRLKSSTVQSSPEVAEDQGVQGADVESAESAMPFQATGEVADEVSDDSVAPLRAELDLVARRLSKHYYATASSARKVMAPQALTQTAPDTTNYDALEGRYLDLCSRLTESTVDSLSLSGMRDLVQKIADRPGSAHHDRAVALLDKLKPR